jgi:hypothetical protein
MSFLADPPLLVATGAAIERYVDDPRRARRLRRATVAVFVGTSVALYLDRPWTRWLWRLCRASSGRDWMVNSGVLRIDVSNLGGRDHVLAAALFALYPLWIELGRRLGRRSRGDAQPDLATASSSVPR